MMKLPPARTADIVMQELEKEILVYDLKVNKAFNLNETSAIIYSACNGKTTFDELKAEHKFTDDLIYLALDGLKKVNLLDEDYNSPFINISRRTAVRQVGLATMIALPFIASLTAPTAAHAASCTARILTDPQNCGACGRVCSNNHIFSPTCSGGICDGTCNTGWEDCNGNKQTDGCETNIGSDLFNCGGCGTVCSTNHVNVATLRCAGGNCFGTCNTGFGNCIGTFQANGCETNLNTSNSHCGFCGNACTGGAFCVNGNCILI
ncbi:MAG: hypothetical protein K1X72_19965 [Pyrinomonadaceae bacterium]|nr:hypothetical protein [Pyrinomonadaceae bacterium]